MAASGWSNVPGTRAEGLSSLSECVQEKTAGRERETESERDLCSISRPPGMKTTSQPALTQ